MQAHRRGRGLRGLGIIPYDQLSPAQWYELIALSQGQPLASIQAYYGATATGSNVTNLAVVVGAHSIAQTAYDVYQIGGIVDAVQGGHYFQYGGGYVAWAKSGGGAAANPWAMPAQAPTSQQVTAQYAAGQALTQTAYSAPVYTEPQNTTAVVAAYNQANPQAPVVVQSEAPVQAVQAAATPVTGTQQVQTAPATSVQATDQTPTTQTLPTPTPSGCPAGTVQRPISGSGQQSMLIYCAPLPPAPQVVNPSPPSQSTATGTSPTSVTSAVSQANGATGSYLSDLYSQGTSGDLLSTVSGFLSGSEIGGIPNWVFVAGGGVLLLLMLGHKR